MFDTEYATIAVVVIALALVTPSAAGITVAVAPDDGSAASSARFDPTNRRGGESVDARSNESIRTQDDGASVEVRNLTAESVTLRNVTATDVVVRELTVLRTNQRRNVTLRNVSLQRVVVERANVSEVRLGNATIRSRRLLSQLGIPAVAGVTVANRSVGRISVSNRTVDGVIIEHLTVHDASGLNLSVPANVTGNASVNASSPEVTVGDVSVDAVRSFRVSFRNRTVTRTAGADVATATNETEATAA